MKSFTIPLVAILALTVLEALALTKGLDGMYFSGVVIAISGIAGYKIKSIIDQQGKS